MVTFQRINYVECLTDLAQYFHNKFKNAESYLKQQDKCTPLSNKI